jgi:hypothetical protein
LEGRFEGTRFTYHVVRLLQAIDRKLVSVAAVLSHFATDGVIEMKGVAHDAESDSVLFQQGEKTPEIMMKDGVTTGYVKIWRTLKGGAHLQATA